MNYLMTSSNQNSSCVLAVSSVRSQGRTVFTLRLAWRGAAVCAVGPGVGGGPEARSQTAFMKKILMVRDSRELSDGGVRSKLQEGGWRAWRPRVLYK